MPVKYDIPVWKGNSVAIPMRLTQIVGDLREPVKSTGSLLLFKALMSGSSSVSVSPTSRKGAPGIVLLEYLG